MIWLLRAGCRWLLFSLSTLACLGAETRPNILWLSAEDIGPHFGCYGDPHAVTPNLDALAAEGVRYSHAFTAAGVCAPVRSTVITGMYQTTIGTHHMRCNATLPEDLRPFPMLLREAGYYCTNNSKTDYQFSQPNKDEIWDACGGKSEWNKRPNAETPFFAVYNFTGCHESGIASESKYHQVTEGLKKKQRQNAEALTTLPPYYPDTPKVREDWKRNYELITAMDVWAGEHIDRLKEAGLYDNTVIVFWSDHGVGLPRAKRWLYDSGTRVPFIVRVPEALRESVGAGAPGTVEDRLISSLDFGPTALALAGVKVPENLQGRAFLGAGAGQPRDYVFGARDRMDERYDIVRAVRDQQFRYIRNYTSLKPYYQYMNTPEKGVTMQEIRRLQQAGELSGAAALFCSDTKPVEELYDLAADPHEINNLVEDPAYSEKLAELRAVQLQWAAETGDLGLLPESEIEQLEQGQATRSLSEYEDPTLSAQIVRIADVASRGLASGLPEYLAACEHTNQTIRFWGATGIGNALLRSVDDGDFELTQARPHLRALLDDEFTSVRVAAARALLAAGAETEGLKALELVLQGSHQWGRLEAAIVLDEADEAARPALGALQAALVDQPNKYIIRVANKAVNDLLGTENRVP